MKTNLTNLSTPALEGEIERIGAAIVTLRIHGVLNLRPLYGALADREAVIIDRLIDEGRQTEALQNARKHFRFIGSEVSA